MAEKIKVGSLKTVAFDTFKNDFGLTDVKVRIINANTGVLEAGCETLLTELPVDPTELALKQGALTADVVLGSNSISVLPADAQKFGLGDIVEVRTATDEIFAKTKILSINNTTGVIVLDGAALLGALVTDAATLKLVDATGTYKGNVQIPSVTGTYFVWISSISAGKDYNYGMIDVVTADLTDVMTELEDIKARIAGSGAAAWGQMQI